MQWLPTNHLRTFSAIILLAGLSFSCKKDKISTVIKPDLLFYVLTDNNQLHQFNANNATTSISSAALTGLQAGEKMLSIDFRPATGQLYGVGNSSRIYVINPVTGVARAIGTTAFTPALTGTTATIDFNPTVDRIRLITNTGQNLRLNPETGGVAATDGVINGAAGAIVSEAAYTNNFAGATTTVLFDIDATNNKLYRQDPPNNGTLVEIGNLNVDVSGLAGFDIKGDNNTAIAALNVSGVTGLYSIDLNNGSSTFYDAFPAGINISGLAIPTQNVAYAVDVDNILHILNPTSAIQAPITKTITGLQAAEKILGIDFRPVNGQLYGLGSTGNLYTFNLSTGAAVAVGAIAIPISGTDFGFDFNPTVDRIRIISNTGQNLRVNPNDGLVAAADLPLNPGTPAVTAAAYTNNFAGATSTQLFDIDHNTDRLYRQDPPNNGTLVDIGPIGINITGVNGFDIGGTSGTGIAILTVGGTASLYTINITTGAATKMVDFPKSVQGFALGLGF